MSVLYVSSNIMDYLYKGQVGSLFSKNFTPNEFTSQLATVYREIKRKNYQFAEGTSVKEFFRDILEPLYPNLSQNDRAVFWRFFKKEEALSSQQKPS